MSRARQLRTLEREGERARIIGVGGFDADDDALGGKHLPDRVAPLDDRDTGTVDQLLEPEVMQLLDAIEPVHVHVGHRKTAVVLLHERERRARHRPFDAKSARDSLREGRLARPEIADEHDDVAGFEVRRERGRDCARLVGRSGAKDHDCSTRFTCTKSARISANR